MPGTIKSLAIIDLGGQYCHLISRRLRDIGIPSDIVDHDVPTEELRTYSGIILSGGPNSVYDTDAPTIDSDILGLDVPILGVCYGHQLLAKLIGAKVEPDASEFGLSTLSLAKSNSLFNGTPHNQSVWMSHSDSVTELPMGVTKLAETDRCKVAAFADFQHKFYGVQFHPEVVHSEYGTDVLRNFGGRICGLEAIVTTSDQVSELISDIRTKAGRNSVFFLVSGGVDSTVAFALCAKALPHERILGMYVDTGLMRKNETEELRTMLSSMHLDDRLKIWDASDRFIEALSGETDPEKKRHIIGRLFVDIQSEAMVKYGIDENHWLLGQGTIYPDTIESGGRTGKAALIKTHHNRCEEIRHLIDKGRVIEPLVEFYKDEVRRLGLALGLDPKLVNRWPFPGPGLGIRCICSADEDDTHAIALAVPQKFSNYDAVRLPIYSVGVQGDRRTYKEIVALRGPLDYPALQELSTNLCNIDHAHNRVIVLIEGQIERLCDAAIIKPSYINAQRLYILREADFIARMVLAESGLTESVWQFPVVLVPMSFHGGETIVLRPVNSEDGMTANFARLPRDILHRIGKDIANVGGVDAVFLDITDKPPGTIEWE